MYKKELDKKILSLILFKSNMGLTLSREKVRYIWGYDISSKISKSVFKQLDDIEYGNSKIIKQKLKIAKKNLNILFISDWVKFVGISGSVAAGFAKEEDDIDLFIIVKNGCAWIYRGILTVRNIFNHVIRTKRDRGNVKDLFCINLIVEERGLEFDADIFNFHELIYLIPIYRKKYLKKIFRMNEWLSDKYMIKEELVSSIASESNEVVNIGFRFINICAFLLQLIFMFFTGHKPDINRLLSNYKKGKIEFFPKDYKKNILNGLKSHH